VAVDAYNTSPSNQRLDGKRQYPTLGKKHGPVAAPVGTPVATPTGTPDPTRKYQPLASASAGTPYTTRLGIPDSNPNGGTEGGSPKWVDVNGDGERSTRRPEDLWYKDPSVQTSLAREDHWETNTVVHNGTQYLIDSRDYFIDFDELVRAGFLESVPKSASPDNNATATGSYSWYVDSNGQVKSLYYFYPKPDSTGYKGVFP